MANYRENAVLVIPEVFVNLLNRKTQSWLCWWRGGLDLCGGWVCGAFAQGEGGERVVSISWVSSSTANLSSEHIAPKLHPARLNPKQITKGVPA